MGDEFVWKRSAAGYQWVEARELLGGAERNIYVTPATSVQGEVSSEWYKVQESLFLRFAAVAPTRQGILEFGTEYGLFGGQHTRRIGPLEGGNISDGDRLDIWTQQISEMRIAVDLWRRIQSGKDSELEPVIHWTDPAQVTLQTGGTWALIASKHDEKVYHTKLFDIVQLSNRFRTPAKFHLANMVNKAIAGEVSPILKLVDGEAFRYSHEPLGLLGALWNQFARAIAGDTKHSQCRQCNEWFRLSRADEARGKAFCSNRCKAKNYRTRRESAVARMLNGDDIKTVAKEASTTVAQVRKWAKGAQS